MVINTLNRAQCLERLLLALERLRYPEFEVVIVEGPCEDHTREIIERWSDRVTHVSCPVANLSRSRNLGLLAAHASIVAFIDDDAVPEFDWLDKLSVPFADPRTAVAGGPLRDRSGVTFQSALGTSKFTVVTPLPAERADADAPTQGANFCVRREWALSVGGFDEAFSYFLEEADHQRALSESGGAVVFVEEAEVHHGFAANKIRSEDRLPKDFGVTCASLTYFCLKHGGGEKSRAAIRRRLTGHMLWVKKRIALFLIKGRIDRQIAESLWDSTMAGLKRGLELSRRSATNLCSSDVKASGAGLFRRFNPPVQDRLRLALVANSKSAIEGEGDVALLARACAARGHEVTLLIAGCAQHTVAFQGSFWIHRVPPAGLGRFLPWLTWLQRTGIKKELKRVTDRRSFNAVLSITSTDDSLTIAFPHQRDEHPQWTCSNTRSAITCPQNLDELWKGRRIDEVAEMVISGLRETSRSSRHETDLTGAHP